MVPRRCSGLFESGQLEELPSPRVSGTRAIRQFLPLLETELPFRQCVREANQTVALIGVNNLERDPKRHEPSSTRRATNAIASRIGDRNRSGIGGVRVVSGTNAEWIRLAVEIVAANQPCTANKLIRALKQNGASTAAANQTFFAIVRDGYVRRTWNGKLKLP